MANGALMGGMRGTPPPSYDQPVQRLGLPSPAFTSKAMQQTRQKYVDQTQNMFNSQTRPESQAGYGSGSASRPGTRGNDVPRATSPAPPRSASPLPPQAETRQAYRSASPNPYAGSQRARTQSTVSTPQNRNSDQGFYHRNSPNDVARAVSPAPFRDDRPGSRPGSSHVSNDMSIQLAPAPDDYGSQGRGGGRSGVHSRQMSYYNGAAQGGQVAARQRSKSVADVRQFNREGRPILNFGMWIHFKHLEIC